MTSINQSPQEHEASRDEDWRVQNLTTVYEEVCKSYHNIDDFRSKLLALLPFASGTSIFFLLKDGFPSASYLVAIGIFGFVVTFGLFSYELHGIRRCIRLIELGKRIEGLMGIGGQFWHRPPDFYDKVGPKLAALVIYPAVLGSWAYVTLFTWPLLAPVGALVVFLIGLIGSWKLDWKAKLEPEPKRQFRIAKYKTLREPEEKKDVIDPHCKLP